MFTGIIGQTGSVTLLDRAAGGARMRVAPSAPIEGLAVGESIAVSGACLSVEAGSAGDDLRFFLSDETLARTSLGEAAPGRRVNLERALRPEDRLGGHLVLGHVDGVGVARRLERNGEGWLLEVEHPADLAPFLAVKGSIAVDGISLTVTQVGPDGFGVAVIPLTMERTTLKQTRPGQRVNLEADVLARYVVRGLQALAGGAKADSGLSLEKLLAAGFGR
jgi:riboflavin synthase